VRSVLVPPSFTEYRTKSANVHGTLNAGAPYLFSRLYSMYCTDVLCTLGDEYIILFGFYVLSVVPVLTVQCSYYILYTVYYTMIVAVILSLL